MSIKLYFLNIKNIKFFILSNWILIRQYTTWFTLVPAHPRRAWHNIKQRRQCAYVFVVQVLVVAIPHLQVGTFQRYGQTQGLQWICRLHLDSVYSWRWSCMCVMGNMAVMPYLGLAIATCAEYVHVTSFLSIGHNIY